MYMEKKEMVTRNGVVKGKPILYVDMDNTIVDFKSGVRKYDKAIQERYKGKEDEIPHVFARMDAIPGAVKAVKALMEPYDVYILSTASWDNVTALDDKREWLKEHFGECIRKRAIFTHRKDLCIGDYLVDDLPKNGTSEFGGKWIQIGSQEFPDWKAVSEYLLRELA